MAESGAFFMSTPSSRSSPNQDLIQAQAQQPSLNPSETSSTPEAPRNKRARPTISCLECRRKKLKCDRVQPCMQCKKSDREALCSFANKPSLRSAAEDEARKRARAERIALRMSEQEDGGGKMDWVANYGPPVSSVPERLNERPSPDTQGATSSLGRIYVKGARSRYLGVGDRMAILDHFEEAKLFIMTSFEEPDMKGMMNELSSFQRLSQRKPKKAPPTCPSLGRPGLIAEMLKAIPDEAFWITFWTQYCGLWETLNRVLHIPTFRREVNALFVQIGRSTQPRPENLALGPNVRESLIPQMIAIMVLSARLANHKLPEEECLSEEQVIKYVTFVQTWVDGLRGKERLTLDALQTQTLLLLVHQNLLCHPSTLWKESGDLVRSAMIIGLHHDPEDCEDLSLFVKEQRRKLWRTIVELDIQSSLAASMPAAIRSSDFVSRSLRNVDDLYLKKDMAEYPADQEPQVWIDAIPQIALGINLCQRLDATNIIGGNVNLVRDVDFLLQRAIDLEASLQMLPTPIKSDTIAGRDYDKDPGKLFAKLMIDIYIRRPALAIYRVIALSPQSTHYPEARKGAVLSSIAILSHLDALDPTVADLNTIRDRSLLNHFHILCKNDIIQAVYFLCFEIQKFSQSATNTQGLHEDVSWTKHSLTRIVENTLNSLLQRVGDFGSDLKDILPLSVVFQSTRSDAVGQEKRELMIKGAERVRKACREVMPEIKDLADKNMATVGNNDQRDNSLQLAPVIPPVGPGSSFPWSMEMNGVPGNSTFGDFNTIGGEIDFQDFDFGLGDWSMDQSWI